MREMTISAARQRRSGPYIESCRIVSSDLRRFRTPLLCLSPDHQRIGCSTSNGIDSEQVPWHLFRTQERRTDSHCD